MFLGTKEFAERMEDRFKEYCPWGLFFASRRNFEYGYFTDEGYLVAKYLKKSSNILIIGSGNGREAYPISCQNHRIVCMDMGALYCLSGQKSFRDKGIKDIYFIQGDMLHLPFAKKSFDFIFFSLYPYAMEDRFEILKNIRIILCSSGVVLLSCVTPLYKSKLPGQLILISTEAELSKEVSSCGFDVLESRVDSKRPEYRFSILRTG